MTAIELFDGIVVFFGTLIEDGFPIFVGLLGLFLFLLAWRLMVRPVVKGLRTIGK